MKKFITLMMMVAILFTSIATVGAEESVDFSKFNYDFENFTSKLPDGLSGMGTAASLDNVHGVSLKEAGRTKINIDSSITSGAYRLSFDMAADASKTITVRASSSEYDGHYLLYLNGNKINISGDTGKNKWNFTYHSTYEALKWYRYDFIVEMGGTVICYIDGVKAGEVQTNFNDLIGFNFLGEGSGYYYLDNLKIDVYDPSTKMEGSVKSSDNLISKTQSEMGFIFSETINQDTLNQNGIKVYNMGTNPLEYGKTSASFSITEKGSNYVVLNFGDNLIPGAIYKVEFSGVESIYKKSYSINEAYFAVEGELKEIDVLYDDFTGITQPAWAQSADSWNWVPVIPTGKTDSEKWSSGGTGRVFPCWTDKENKKTAVEFLPVAGDANSAYGDTLLSKKLPVEMKTKAEVEFNMKIDAPGHFTFYIGDSANIYSRLMEVNENGINAIYETDKVKKIADFTKGEFMDIKFSIDLVNGLFDVYVNGEKCADGPYKLSSTSYGGSGAHATNIKAFRFLQSNKYRYDDAKNVEEARAHTYVEYIKAKSFTNIPAVAMIYFTDAKGNKVYPDEKIPADICKTNILFAGDIDGKTLDGNVTLTNEETKEVIVPTGLYNNAESIYELDIPNYLEGNAEYTIALGEGVADKTGEALNPVSGLIKTDDGKFEATGIKVEASGNTVDVTAKIVHTNASLPKYYIIYAGYQGTKMKGFDFEEIELTEMQRKVESKVSFTIENLSDFDRVKGFIWDGFDTMIPLFDFAEEDLDILK